MLGAPIAHSLSPVLHGAAYAALGLDGWKYEAIECDDHPDCRVACWTHLTATGPGCR